MIRAGFEAVAMVTALTLALAAGAAAQTAAPATGAKQKPKANAAPTIAVTVTNKRTTGLAELDIAQTGSPAFKPFVRKLAPGKQTVITLPRDENCVFDLFMKYEDGATSTVPGFNVCDDGKINLVD
ncbi:MAG TPA: hypothetical protein VGY52_14535 [Roseiarcus sp.]|nr:hypothetical protein [Roseiarcus sp.]